MRKNECCGCCACVDICRHKAIALEPDNEGFWYPTVDRERCTECGACDRVCPELNILRLKRNDYPKPSKSIAAIHRKLNVRWESTSGGAYSALAQTMYEREGYVSGAIYNDDFSLRNFVSNDPDDLERLRSSKYLQSCAEGLYLQIRELLQRGERVLACGTPCQMAALRSFLHIDYPNLIVVDFICRGVNSPRVYRSYLDSLERRYGSRVVAVKAKNKELGWRNLTRKVTFESGDSYYGVAMEDDFRRGYHANLYCRPSCYSCKYKGFPRISDITIADYWGIERIDKNLDNNIGTSMILLNSRRGEEYFALAAERMEWRETPFDSILSGNVALTQSIVAPSVDRAELFGVLDREGFDAIVARYFPRSCGADNGVKARVKAALGFVGVSRVRELCSVLGLHVRSYINFVWLNFRRRSSVASWARGEYIITMPDAVFDVAPTARIVVGAPLIFGNNPVRGMRMASCLRMEHNTTFEIRSGVATRYDDAIYNLRYGAYIEIVNGGKLTIGRGASNVGLTIMCAKEVTIGGGVRIGRNVSIRDWNGPHVIVNDTYVNHAAVVIEDNVWLCSGCAIMPGVRVGRGSVIGAGAVVTHDVPPHSLVVGSPARVVKESVRWY
ncbi:MAG: Coenzyme F420 hydrogenase/dehydrogenase, beta subunit C-terminal domain [Rikenellaceae bacterium]